MLQGGVEKHPTGVADLCGTRYVIVSETDEAERLSEALVKRLTGNGQIKARRMHENFFSFKRTFKLFLATNYKPDVKGRNHAIWRRIRLVPFGVTFVKEGEEINPPFVRREDPNLRDEIRKEFPGILALMVRGCLDWQRVGTNPPKAVLVETAKYRQDQDRLIAFLDENTKNTRTGMVKARELYREYCGYMKSINESPMTESLFGRELKSLGYERKKSRCIWYLGIELALDTVPPDESLSESWSDATQDMMGGLVEAEMTGVTDSMQWSYGGVRVPSGREGNRKR